MNKFDEILFIKKSDKNYHKRLYDEFCKQGMSHKEAFDKASEVVIKEYKEGKVTA